MLARSDVQPVADHPVAERDLVVVPKRMYDGYIFDLDGTIYLGSSLLPGAHRLITTLRSMGRRVVFLSNNPTRDVQMYVEKLTKLGLATPPEEIVTTVFTTTQWILQNAPDAVVYPISEEPLIRSFRENGIRMSEDPAEIDIVVASYDRMLTWKKLQIGFEAMWFHRRAKLICTNADHFCPFPGGRGEVDAGAVVSALEDATQMKLAVNCGKPSRVMLDTIMNVMGLDTTQCITTGDRLYTEIKMGIDFGHGHRGGVHGRDQPGDAGGLACRRPTHVRPRPNRPPDSAGPLAGARVDGSE